MSDPDLTLNLEIISVHVPKTAGITFGNILKQVYGSERIFLDYPWNDPVDPVELQNDFQAIHGHFPVSKYQDLPSHIKRIAWMRNPIDRLISHYFYWKHLPISKQSGNLHRYVIENQVSLLDFAKIPAMINHISQWYINIDLSEFYFVGIHEFFEEDWTQLSCSLGFPNLQVNHQNSNRSAEYRSFKKSMEYRNILLELIDLNSEDMQLYQLALKKRYARI
jgi:hypothetical protein